MTRPSYLIDFIKLHLIAMATSSATIHDVPKLPPLRQLEKAFVGNIMEGKADEFAESDIELSKFEVYAVVRATIQAICELMGQPGISEPSCFLVPYLDALKHEFDTGEQTELPPMKELQDMQEPELRNYLNRLMGILQAFKPSDVLGFTLVAFQNNAVSHYVSSVCPSTLPAALREIADRIEARDAVTKETKRDR